MAKFAIGETVGVKEVHHGPDYYDRPRCLGIIRSEATYETDEAIRNGSYVGNHYRVQVLGYRPCRNADGCYRIHERLLEKIAPLTEEHTETKEESVHV